MSRILRAAGAAAVLAMLLGACATEDEPQARSTDETNAGRTHVPQAAPCASGDVEEEPPADGGIASVEVRHLETAIEVEVRFDDLDPGLEQVVQIVVATPARAWSLGIDRLERRRGEFRVGKFFAPIRKADFPDPDDVGECAVISVMSMGAPCRGIRADLSVDDDVVQAAIPRPCLENPRWVQVGIQSSFIEGDDVVMSDEWGERARGASLWEPPLGERVDAAAGAPIGCVKRVARERDGPGPGTVVVIGKRPCIR